MPIEPMSDNGLLAFVLTATFVAIGVAVSSAMLAVLLGIKVRWNVVVVAWIGCGASFLFACGLLSTFRRGEDLVAERVARSLGSGFAIPYALMVLFAIVSSIKAQLREVSTRLIGPVFVGSLALLLAITGAAFIAPSIALFLGVRKLSQFSSVAVDFGVSCLAYAFLASLLGVVVSFVVGLTKVVSGRADNSADKPTPSAL